MCPPLVIVGASLAIKVGSAVAAHAAEAKASKQNAEAARKAFQANIRSINLIEGQVRRVGAQSIYQATRQARSARALSQISAGESGVAGASAEAVLRDIDRDLLEFEVATRRQTQGEIDRLQNDKITGNTTMRSRIASRPPPNPFVTGLQIGGAVLGSANQFRGLNADIT